MSIQQQILDTYKGFQSFLEGVDLEEIKKLSRTELTDLQNKLYQIRFRNIAFEISNAIKEKKEDQFPQLKGVHHYPVINDIDFLNEEIKMALDKYLVGFRVGQYLGGLSHVVSGTDARAQTERFLIEKEIVVPAYIIKCPCCHSGHLSNPLTEEACMALVSEIQEATQEDFEQFEMDDRLQMYCSDCEKHIEQDVIKNDERRVISKYIKLDKQRDTTYDNL